MFKFRKDALEFFIQETAIQFENLHLGLGRTSGGNFCIIYDDINSVQFTPYELYEQTLHSLECDIQELLCELGSLDASDEDDYETYKEDHEALRLNEEAKESLLLIDEALIRGLKFKYKSEVDVVILPIFFMGRIKGKLKFDAPNDTLGGNMFLNLN